MRCAIQSQNNKVHFVQLKLNTTNEQHKLYEISLSSLGSSSVSVCGENEMKTAADGKHSENERRQNNTHDKIKTMHNSTLINH